MTLFYYYLWLGLSYMGENMKNTHKSSSALFNFFFLKKKNCVQVHCFLMIYLSILFY